MASIQDLVAAVDKETTDTGSLIALLAGIKQQLADALAQVGQLTPEQQAAIDGVFDKLNANDQAVADALGNNVPPPPPDPASRRRP
jgi:hypothetical protein